MIGTPEALLRLLIGALFGGLIGYERQVRGRPAGVRTHMLVCIASVLIMEVSEHFVGGQDPSYVRVDPGRIAAGAITGIGFLGAGVIIRMGATVQGLTTAASIWMVSAIGLALGRGLYWSSSSAFVMTLFVLIVLKAVERKAPKLTFKFLNITCGEGIDEEEINAILTNHRVSVRNTDYEKDSTTGETVLYYTIGLDDGLFAKALVDEISALKAVKKVSLRH